MTTCVIVARLIPNISIISLAECLINACAFRVFCSSSFFNAITTHQFVIILVIAIFLSASFSTGYYKFLTLKQNIRTEIPLDLKDNSVRYFIQYCLE